MPRPGKGNKVNSNVKLPYSLWKEAKLQAIREGMTIGVWIARAIEEKLDRVKEVKR